MLRKLIPAGLLAVTAMASVVNDVETALSHGNFPLAEAILQSYRSKSGVTPEFLEALSWLARGDLITRQFDQADSRAKETEQLAEQALATRPLDAEPHLPTALGAAIEVEAQVLTANGDRTGALALLRKDLEAYRSTSIRTRIQKNINLLTLEGRPAPALEEREYLGAKRRWPRSAGSRSCCSSGRTGVRTASRRSIFWPPSRESILQKAWC